MQPAGCREHFGRPGAGGGQSRRGSNSTAFLQSCTSLKGGRGGTLPACTHYSCVTWGVGACMQAACHAAAAGKVDPCLIVSHTSCLRPFEPLWRPRPRIPARLPGRRHAHYGRGWRCISSSRTSTMHAHGAAPPCRSAGDPHQLLQEALELPAGSSCMQDTWPYIGVEIGVPASSAGPGRHAHGSMDAAL